VPGPGEDGRLRRLCVLRLCRPLGFSCLRCGRVVFNYDDRGRGGAGEGVQDSALHGPQEGVPGLQQYKVDKHGMP